MSALPSRLQFVEFNPFDQTTRRTLKLSAEYARTIPSIQRHVKAPGNRYKETLSLWVACPWELLVPVMEIHVSSDPTATAAALPMKILHRLQANGFARGIPSIRKLQTHDRLAQSLLWADQLRRDMQTCETHSEWSAIQHKLQLHIARVDARVTRLRQTKSDK